MATFIDPARTNRGSFAEIRDWALAWDTYDTRLHDEHPMPALYPAARHVNWGHCIIAVMLLISVIRQSQEHVEDIEAFPSSA